MMIPRKTNSHQTSDMFHITERYENKKLAPSLSFHPSTLQRLNRSALGVGSLASRVFQQHGGLSIPRYRNVKLFECTRFELPLHEGQNRSGVARLIAASFQDANLCYCPGLLIDR